jgi:predicted lipoprotein
MSTISTENAGSRTAAPRATRPALLSARGRKGLVGLLAAGVLAAIAATTTTVAADDEGATGVGRESFDAIGYATERYESEVVPTIKDNAVEITELLPALISDPEATGKAYGHRSGVSSPFSYAVTGSGVAGAVDGTRLPVAIEGLPDDVEVVVQIGPAITGTALRDATGLIGFGDFVNQMEYADASTELNNRVKEAVLADFDAAAAEGQTVTFTGALTYGSNTALLQVTPVELELEQ